MNRPLSFNLGYREIDYLDERVPFSLKFDLTKVCAFPAAQSVRRQDPEQRTRRIVP